MILTDMGLTEMRLCKPRASGDDPSRSTDVIVTVV